MYYNSHNSEPMISVRSASKSYMIYAKPEDRLKQVIIPRLQKFISRPLGVFGINLEPRIYYREFSALDDVSFDVAQGETVGIIGRNGSGKSTLLQLICGVLQPSNGSATVRGRIAALLELGSGFNPEFTGRENIFLNASILGLTQAETEAALPSIIEFADIGDFIDQPVKTYSSGMGLRLAFSVIAHVNADVLIVDEALAVGDAYFQQKCFRWLRRFKETGTVLFVSHDTGSVIGLCDRAIWLDHGRMVANGPAKEVCEQYFATQYSDLTGSIPSSPDSLSKQIEVIGQDFTGEITPDLSTVQNSEENGLDDTLQIAQVFEFNESSSSFGNGEAEITGAFVTDINDQPIAFITGGELVKLRIRILCKVDIYSPIVGFHVKDRLGQALFGDNTFMTYRDTPLDCRRGDILEAVFVFTLPFLQTGDYAISVAVASGTIDLHVQHHWLHDAIIFKVHSPFRNGVMIAIPMQSITMDLVKRDK